MRVRFSVILLLFLFCLSASSQDYNQLTDTGEYTPAGSKSLQDSLKSKSQEIPKGLKVWTVDERFGERFAAEPDTLPHMYMNTIFASGLRGEYNTLGNLGSPRINRIFVDRKEPEQFIFTQPYDYFVTPIENFQFTNTLSPITNISYNECGNRTNGENHFNALFAVNAGKKFGAGFKFDYIYGRGYYDSQSTSHFNYTMYASYLGERYNAHFLFSTNHEKVTENGGITDDEYITHPEAFDDNYRESEIPTVFDQNWNRNDNQHIFFTHRYSLGFSHKVPMTEEEIAAKKFAIESQKENEANRAKEAARRKAEREGRDFDEDNYQEEKTYAGRPDDAKIAGNEPAVNDTLKNERISVDKETADSLLTAQIIEPVDSASMWMKDEYVPVTSFIHTLKYDNYNRIYEAYNSPDDYYLNTYNAYDKFSGDSIYDKTHFFSLKNTFAIALLEGFHSWAKFGLRAFITSDLRHFELPDSINGTSTYTEHDLSVGGQLSKSQGTMFHYGVTAEVWLTGVNSGQLKIDANADLNFRLFKDTVTLAARAFIHRVNPTFYFRHYHSKHLWWDNDNLSQEIRTRIEGSLSLKRTKTMLRVAFDDLKDYTYFAQKYDITSSFGRAGNTVTVEQSSGNISLLTLQLAQDFSLGPLKWENMITYQKSSNQDVLPVPLLNIYTNLYFHFMVAHVLTIDLGGDLRYFTKYKAPDYCPALGQYTVQNNGENNVDVGNYPYINVYANFHLKHTRFFVMMSHINSSAGNYFLTPHYPCNGRVLRFGVSWNFFN
ncbi:MAG: putative porin [Prevotella sp.]|nr:putative porin [Prevotella sp.]